MRPILRWAGSKRQLLPRLRSHWSPSFHRYIEPFCGSACLFFDLEPATAILGDLNEELIITYRILQRDPSLVASCLLRLPRGKLAYYKIRKMEPENLSEPEVAARFLYLNRFCFNGIYRTNMRGRFNVPYGTQKKLPTHDIDGLLRCSRLLQKATLLRADFETTIARAEAGDFVYLDPPYAVGNRRIFAEYHPDSFSISDLERLSLCLDQMNQRGVHFVVSYADSKEARKLLEPWSPKRVLTRRNVAGFASDRKSAFELIASNTTYAH